MKISKQIGEYNATKISTKQKCVLALFYVAITGTQVPYFFEKVYTVHCGMTEIQLSGKDFRHHPHESIPTVRNLNSLTTVADFFVTLYTNKYCQLQINCFEIQKINSWYDDAHSHAVVIPHLIFGTQLYDLPTRSE